MDSAGPCCQGQVRPACPQSPWRLGLPCTQADTSCPSHMLPWTSGGQRLLLGHRVVCCGHLPPLTATSSRRPDEPVNWRASGHPKGRAKAGDIWLWSLGHSSGLTWPLGPCQPSLPLQPRPSARFPPGHIMSSWSMTRRALAQGRCFLDSRGSPVAFSSGPHPGDGVHCDLTRTLTCSGVGHQAPQFTAPGGQG